MLPAAIAAAKAEVTQTASKAKGNARLETRKLYLTVAVTVVQAKVPNAPASSP